jgi:hypothetical protein
LKQLKQLTLVQSTPMLKIISRFTTSFAALLTDQPAVVDHGDRIENIREEMLRALSKAGVSHHLVYSKTWSAVVDAVGVDALWYLRSDLLALLTEQHGETAARKQLAEITERFRGMVHKSQMPVQRSAKSSLQNPD